MFGQVTLSIFAFLILPPFSLITLGSAVTVHADEMIALFGGFVPGAKVTVGVSTLDSSASSLVCFSIIGSGVSWSADAEFVVG